MNAWNKLKPGLPAQTLHTSPRKNPSPLAWPWAFAFFTILLLLPALAIIKLGRHVDWWLLFSYQLLLWVLTIACYRIDKRKAEQGQWRIPEVTLHSLEFFGGWPAALLAQRFFRHKTKKGRYQLVFWLIVLGNQLTAFEFVSNGWLLRTVWQTIGR